MQKTSTIAFIFSIFMLLASLLLGWETDTGSKCLGWAIVAWVVAVTTAIVSLIKLTMHNSIILRELIENPESVTKLRDALHVIEKGMTEK